MGNSGNGQSDQPWNELAPVYAASRQVSADKLIEWPAQLRLAGDFRGKRVLDVGCGTGDKTRYFAEHGATSALGIDGSSGFASQWKSHAGCSNLQLIQARFEDLHSLPQLRQQRFDLIVSFQALMYADDLAAMVNTLTNLLVPNGILVISVPHPFRFAILRNEIEGCGYGAAYQKTQPYRYPSPWDSSLFLEHSMPRISDYLNAITSAGLRITACEEPVVTDELRSIAPEKAEWMDRYVGIIIFQAQMIE